MRESLSLTGGGAVKAVIMEESEPTGVEDEKSRGTIQTDINQSSDCCLRAM